MNDKEKIHVCHLVYSFNIGGLERVIINCINALDKEKYRHSIVALTNVGEFIQEVDGQIDFYALHKKVGHNFGVHWELYKLLRSIKPDVLHSYNLSTIEYQWVASLLNVNLRVHAEHGRDSYDVDGSVWKYRFLRKAMSPFINTFIAVSKDLSDWLSEDVNIPKRKVSLIANGVDTDFFFPERNGVACQRESEGKFVFGHVSRLHPIKNQSFIIECFKAACLTNPSFMENCVLVFVGDGPEEEALKQCVSKVDFLLDKVIFVGAQSDVRRYYREFDVFVMASIAEGIPMTLLEAMSVGVPHLVTPVGGIAEVVERGKTGYVVESADNANFIKALIEAYQEKENLSKLSAEARNRVVSHYSQRKMIASYDRLYSMVGR